MDHPEKLATHVTQDEDKQSKTKKQHNTRKLVRTHVFAVA
jgi:hypothetical protein